MRIKRTLDGVEIDTIISDVEAREALALERQRRADGRKRAASLKASHAQAWAMRDAFDGLLEVIQRWSIEQKR